MELHTKPDWQAAEERMDAWWAGAVLDRPVLLVRAPRKGMDFAAWDSQFLPQTTDPDAVNRWFLDAEEVVERWERIVDATFWGGEAFPVVYPMNTRIVSITAAYLGCPFEIHPISHTAWSQPVIDDWATRKPLVFDPENIWWQRSRKLLNAAAQRASGRYYVGLPDLNAPGQAIAQLRGMQELAVDLVDYPDAVKQALAEANVAWRRYWEAANGVIHQWIEGYFYWMGLWSDRASIDLQCDFNVLISPRMFDEFFLPGLEEQTRWVERTIFHLDGPEAIRHLDALLALPRLAGIQWVPGGGKPPMSKWLPLLHRIQSKGKRLVLMCEPWEVDTLLSNLEPEGLLLSTRCTSQAEAEKLLKLAHKWRRTQWFVE